MRVERAGSDSNKRSGSFGPGAALTAATALAAGLIAAIAWSGPAGLILPALSIVLLAIGFAIAAAHWNDPADSRRLTYKDVGAALVFAAFAAALMSDPGHLAALSERTTQAAVLR